MGRLSPIVGPSAPDSLDIEDHAALVRYLRQKGIIGAESPLQIRTLTGGVSNRTVLVVASPDQSFVVKQALRRLRVKTEWHSDPARIHIEALGLHWLEKLAPPGFITPLLFEDKEWNAIGMKAVPEPHENWKSVLMTREPSLDHIKQFAELLAGIHVASAARASELGKIFEDRTFFETLRLEPYYRYSAEQVPASAEFFGNLISETLEQQITLVHGDYSPKNVLIHAGRLVLLDHEVIHFGDPAFDVGFSLAHLLSKAHHFPRKRIAFIKAAQLYAQRYLALTQGVSWQPAAEQRAVRHTLACLLARVAGRSPLEYLTAEEGVRQVESVVEMMAQPPVALPDFISQFGQRLECR